MEKDGKPEITDLITFSSVENQASLGLSPVV